MSAAGKINEVVLTDTLTTYTGNTPQTGDTFARIGATGSGLTSLATASALSTLATAVGTRSGWDRAASSISHPPPSKLESRSRATSRANAVFPIPPGPVNVTTRCDFRPQNQIRPRSS